MTRRRYTEKKWDERTGTLYYWKRWDVSMSGEFPAQEALNVKLWVVSKC